VDVYIPVEGIAIAIHRYTRLSDLGIEKRLSNTFIKVVGF